MKKIGNHPTSLIAGIYCYRERLTGIIIYIGKDSKLIYDNRHLDHTRIDSKNPPQVIDKVLRKNPEAFVYERVLFCNKEGLEVVEELLIRAYKPRYNIEFNKNS